WRTVLCVRKHHHKPRVRKRCPTKSRFDILAQHPISVVSGPRQGAVNPDDIFTPDMKNLRRVLRVAERARNVLPAGRHPLWATEIWWMSNPPSAAYGVPLKTQARWLEECF